MEIEPTVIPDENSLVADPTEMAKSAESLDALFKVETETPTSADPKPPADAPVPPAKTAEEIAAEEAAAAAATAAAAAKATTKTPEELAAEAAAAAEKAKANPVDEFEKVEMPPHTKPKTGEAFGRVKELARQEIGKVRTELAAAKTELEKAQSDLAARSTQPAVSPELEAELKELREYRLSKDVESDPEFRKVDGDIKSNNDAIVKKLADNGMPREQLEEIAKLGGPENVDWEPLLPKLPLAIRRFVEAKLVDNVNLRDNRDVALEKAKSNAAEFTRTREARSATELAGHVTKFSEQVPWLKDRPIPATATDAEKAQITAHNKFSGEFRTRLSEMVKTQSPEAFAEYAVCTLFATKLDGELKATTTALEKAKTDSAAAIAAVTADRDKLKGELDAIRKAEGGRRPGAAVTIVPAGKVNTTSIHANAGDALDALAKAESDKE